MEEEVWRPLVGSLPEFEKVFEVSNLGRVRYAPRILAQRETENGYFQVQLTHRGNQREVLVHRAVAMAFVGPPPFDGATVNHKDRTRSHNHDSNLEWMSRGDNVRHGIANGGGAVGMANGMTVADPEKVKRMLEDGLKPAEIGRALGVTRQAICQMRKRYKANGWWPQTL